MNQELQELQKYVIELYQKNLLFLKENFFDIFQEVEEMSKSIENGNYKEQYALEMVNGYFDIKNISNGGYYYATNSFEDAEQRTSFVDFTSKSSIDLLRKIGSSEFLAFPGGLEEVLPIVDFINKKVDLKSVEFQKIMKFVYIGVGLGYHIHEIEKKINSYTTLIIEPELEIFRLSLFTIDYTIFDRGSNKLFLSVGEDVKKRENLISQFYYYHSYMNYNIKHYTLLTNLDYIKKEIVDFCENHYAGAFPYKLIIENVKRTINFIKQKDKFLVVKKLHEKKILKSEKVLLVSAGPSLDDYIDVIKKYQDKYLIACVDVIVKKLEKNQIVPDIIYSIDPSHLCADFLTTEDPLFLQNSVVVLLSQQHPDVIKILKERDIKYYVSQFTLINKEIGTLGSVPNVGTFSFYITARLGAKEMYTIGNDAAFHQETGSRYSAGSSYTQTETLEIDTKNEDIVSKEDIVEIKGNLREVVKTNRSLLSFKHNYDAVIESLSSLKYTAYNLSDGVFIDGLTPMSKEEFIVSIQHNEAKELSFQNKFDSISKILELDCYEEDIKILNNIIQRGKKFQSIKVSNRDDFLAKKLDLMIWILEKSKVLSINIYGQIFLDYTNLVDSYINFLLNLRQKDLYSAENLETIKVLWAKGVVSVFKDMKQALKV